MRRLSYDNVVSGFFCENEIYYAENYYYGDDDWLTFQFVDGKNIAKTKTPKSGPLVADVINWEASITPEDWATMNATPIIIKPDITPVTKKKNTKILISFLMI